MALNRKADWQKWKKKWQFFQFLGPYSDSKIGNNPWSLKFKIRHRMGNQLEQIYLARRGSVNIEAPTWSESLQLTWSSSVLSTFCILMLKARPRSMLDLCGAPSKLNSKQCKAESVAAERRLTEFLIMLPEACYTTVDQIQMRSDWVQYVTIRCGRDRQQSVQIKSVCFELQSHWVSGRMLSLRGKHRKIKWIYIYFFKFVITKTQKGVS